ncbi:hypothetical protein [Halospeciosus flavus]
MPDGTRASLLAVVDCRRLLGSVRGLGRVVGRVGGTLGVLRHGT